MPQAVLLKSIQQKLNVMDVSKMLKQQSSLSKCKCLSTMNKPFFWSSFNEINEIWLLWTSERSWNNSLFKCKCSFTINKRLFRRPPWTSNGRCTKSRKFVGWNVTTLLSFLIQWKLDVVKIGRHILLTRLWFDVHATFFERHWRPTDVSETPCVC